MMRKWCGVLWHRMLGVVVMIWAVWVVCKITVGYSDGISKHGRWFEGGRPSVHKERLLALEDSLFFSLYSFSCIPMQARLSPCTDSCPVLIPSIRILKPIVLITISLYGYQYHLHPTPPITLERVFYTVPDIECIVNIVWLLMLILHGSTVKLPMVIFQFAICVATILRNYMCLHPSNGCKYCNEPCSVICWVYLWPNHWRFHICDDCVDELPRLNRFNIRQYPHRSPYSNARIRQ